MATFFFDCPRCGTKEVTFDVLSARTKPGHTDIFMTTGSCRRCRMPSIFEFFDVRGNRNPSSKEFENAIINETYTIHIDPPVFADGTLCPEYVPAEIKGIFDEAARCFSIGAFDASGAMSRKVLDSATRPLIGIEPQSVAKEDPNYISWKTAKDLRLRLDWLFERQRLPDDLKEVASCVHQDGNDAAHSSETIGRESALDLQDFTVSILETLYTRPGRIAANVARRDSRRDPQAN